MHVISQTGVAFAVLNVFILKITCLTCIYVKSKILVRPSVVGSDLPGWLPQP